MSLKIQVLIDHPTVTFAASELARYQNLMSGGAVQPEAGGDPGAVRPEIRIGLLKDMLPWMQTAADPFNDEIRIDIRQGGGMIAGANPRSCLLAVYRLLQEAGCRFLRPGPAGELVPHCDWSQLTVQVDEKPSYRHRGVCIEGAVSREIFLGILDWLPKNGLNAYFIQFREGFTFFDRWYDHKQNPFVPSEAKSVQEIRAIIAEGAAAIRQRGLIYHAVGHGWTCEPFGMPGLGWDAVPTVPEGVSRYFAELGGKRELFHGIPLNTNLCYGNPEVQGRIVDSIVAYAAEHPEVDLIHFWLADGANNHCECPLCRDTLPADFYVHMLNSLDKRLTARGLPHRIVFLIYVDLLWTPVLEHIQNPERFILMFAPITRTYSHPFKPGGRLPAIKPFQRNKLAFPRTAEENLAFLQAWRNLPGNANLDSFDFDYHLMWDHYKDPGHEQLARVLHADLRNLGELGLNGLISCQVQRVFFPSPLLMQIMARMLWNKNQDYETLAAAIYQESYGPDWRQVRQYTTKISELINPAWLRLEEPLVNPEQLERLGRIPQLIQAISPVIQAHTAEYGAAGPEKACWRQSWQLLGLFGDYVLQLASFGQALACGAKGGAISRLNDLKNWVYRHEPQLVFVFDSDILLSTLNGIVRRLPEGS